MAITATPAPAPAQLCVKPVLYDTLRWMLPVVVLLSCSWSPLVPPSCLQRLLVLCSCLRSLPLVLPWYYVNMASILCSLLLTQPSCLLIKCEETEGVYFRYKSQTMDSEALLSLVPWRLCSPTSPLLCFLTPTWDAACQPMPPVILPSQVS